MTEQCTNSVPAGWISAIYFIFFVTVSSLVLLTLFVSVVTTSMDEAKQAQIKEKMSEARIKQMKLEDSTLKNFKAAFSILDLDNSGLIDAEELLIGLQSVGCDPTPEQLREMMLAVDIDRSGRIDLSEFIAVMVNEKRRREDCPPPFFSVSSWAKTIRYPQL